MNKRHVNKPATTIGNRTSITQWILKKSCGTCLRIFPVDIGKTTTTLPSTSHFSLGGADSILDILVLRLSVVA